MSVWCRQSVDGKPDEPYRIEPHSPDQSDADLLAIKAAGASDKGWDVTWTGASTFTATKIRWESRATCVREFWVAD